MSQNISLDFEKEIKKKKKMVKRNDEKKFFSLLWIENGWQKTKLFMNLQKVYRENFNFNEWNEFL